MAEDFEANGTILPRNKSNNFYGPKIDLLYKKSALNIALKFLHAKSDRSGGRKMSSQRGIILL